MTNDYATMTNDSATMTNDTATYEYCMTVDFDMMSSYDQTFVILDHCINIWTSMT